MDRYELHGAEVHELEVVVGLAVTDGAERDVVCASLAVQVVFACNRPFAFPPHFAFACDDFVSHDVHCGSLRCGHIGNSTPSDTDFKYLGKIFP